MDQRSPDSARVTELLIAASDGRREALDELVPLLYDDLRRLAAAHMRREPAGLSLRSKKDRPLTWRRRLGRPRSLATYLPARRASATDPVVALRADN